MLLITLLYMLMPCSHCFCQRKAQEHYTARLHIKVSNTSQHEHAAIHTAAQSPKRAMYFAHIDALAALEPEILWVNAPRLPAEVGRARHSGGGHHLVVRGAAHRLAPAGQASNNNSLEAEQSINNYKAVVVATIWWSGEPRTASQLQNDQHACAARATATWRRQCRCDAAAGQGAALSTSWIAAASLHQAHVYMQIDVCDDSLM
jgi:hypothetical protein